VQRSTERPFRVFGIGYSSRITAMDISNKKLLIICGAVFLGISIVYGIMGELGLVKLPEQPPAKPQIEEPKAIEPAPPKEIPSKEDPYERLSYVLDPNYSEQDAIENIEVSIELLDKYKAEVNAKYGLSEDQESSIIIEGIKKGW